jgi:TolA-binding protein
VATAKKEELREPDPFLKASIQLWDTIATHAPKIGMGLAAIVVVLMIFAGLSAHEKGSRDEAGAAIAKALQVAERPVSKEEPAADAEPVDADEKPFKTDADKQTALIAALTEARGRFPTAEASIAALLPLGNAQLRLGKYDEAAKSYQAYLAQGPREDALRSLAQLGLAHVAEAKKDYPAASAAYDELMKDAPHTFLKDMAALGKASLLEAQGQKQQAADAFQSIKDGYPGSEAAREANERLTNLGLAGVHPTPKASPDGGAAFNPATLTLPGAMPSANGATLPVPKE